jgi:phosphomannomutase
LRSLYCSSDSVRSRGAAVTYLSHNASFHSKEQIAPSNRGIKHLEVTASHNLINYNGLKMVKVGSKPLNPATELFAVQSCAENNDFGLKNRVGTKLIASWQPNRPMSKKFCPLWQFPIFDR